MGKLITVFTSIALTAGTLYASDDTLSLGYQVFREQGLQISGWVFPYTYNATTDGPYGLNMDLFAESGFTVPTYYGTPRRGEYIAPEAGQPWARTGGPRTWPNTGNLEAVEYQYLSDLIWFQYEDEIALNAPSYYASGQTFTDEVAQWMATARQSWAQNVILFTNLAYLHIEASDEGLLANYMSQAKPDMLVFDNHMYTGNTSGGRHEYLQHNFEYLERIRRFANAGHDGSGTSPIPAGKYLQLFEEQPPHLRPSESQQWYDTFSAWAFGYKAVIAYSYNSTVQTGGVTNSLLFDDTKPDQTAPTDRFYLQAEINRQSLNLSPALVSLLSKQVFIVPGQHKGGFLNLQNVNNALPSNVSRWSASAVPDFGASQSQWITNVEVTNTGTANSGLDGDVLISYFMPLVESDDGDDVSHEWYFMVLNALSMNNTTSAQCAQLIRLTFDFDDSGIDSLQRLSRLTGEVEIVPLIHMGGSVYYLDLLLNGGVADLFKFNTGAAFVGIESVPVPEPGFVSAIVGMGLLCIRRRKAGVSN